MDRGLDSLPDSGAAAIAGIEIPSGRKVLDGRAWLTYQFVEDADSLVAELRSVYPRTGLWPLLADTSPGDATRPWASSDYEFNPPSVEEVDNVNPDEVFGRLWTALRISAGQRKPVGAVLGEITDLSAPGEQRRPTGPYQIMLVEVARPADVPAYLGWSPSDQMSPVELSSLLRFWEDVLGWRLAGVGLTALELEGRFPTEAAETDRYNIAARVMAFCPPQYGAMSLKEVEADLSRFPDLSFFSFESP